MFNHKSMTDEQRKQIEKESVYNKYIWEFVRDFIDDAEFGLSFADNRVKELENGLKEFSWGLDDIANTLCITKNIDNALEVKNISLAESELYDEEQCVEALCTVCCHNKIVLSDCPYRCGDDSCQFQDCFLSALKSLKQ